MAVETQYFSLIFVRVAKNFIQFRNKLFIHSIKFSMHHSGIVIGWFNIYQPQLFQSSVIDRNFVENQLLERLKKADMWNGWKEWQVCYQLEVFGQEKEPEVWSIDFGLPEPKVQKGDLGKINVYESIASSELLALIEKRTSWDYVALCGNYRTFNNIYLVTDGNFKYFSSDKVNQVVEPLMEAFPADPAMDREKYMKDIRRWKDKA